MSLIYNDRYYEDMRERFDEVKDGFSRLAILAELRGMGRADLARNLMGYWHTERQQYLEDHGTSEQDVMFDEDTGLEYFVDQREWGTAGDDYQIASVKSWLPMYLFIEHWMAEDSVKS